MESDAPDKLLELRQIEQEIAEHWEAISSLEQRRREVLELENPRLDLRRRVSLHQKRRLMAQACSARR